MATVSSRTPFNRAETQKKIRHPLESLRGYIRSYVVMEGIAVAILFIAVCFWLALIFDFGLFEILMVDWIKQLDQVSDSTAFTLRASLLAAFVIGLLCVVAFMVLRRLFTEFSDQSLALVLERRFPNQLGDRLITAVELAHPDVAEKYGFSQDMVDHTVRAAAERVERLPIGQVFNWRRLWAQWLLALGLSVGVWVGILLGFAGVSAASEANFSDFFSNFSRTNTILAKRNLLLMNRVYWPTRSYIEIVRFQDDPTHPGVMKVGRDEQRPDVKARAFEYVMYDAATADSIRPLKLADLEGWVEPGVLSISLPEDWGQWIMQVDDLDTSVSSHIIPKEWDSATSAKVRADLKDENLKKTLQEAGALQAVENWLNWKTWTVDRLKQQLENDEVRREMDKTHFEAKKGFQKLLEEVDVLAASPWSNWNIRKLKLPDQVYVHYRGQQTKGSSAYERRSENRYYIGLNELKESVTFWVQGENFFTATKEIELVPPPSFREILVTKHEPAYIYYWLPPDEPEVPGSEQQISSKNVLARYARLLKGKKQLFTKQPVSLSGAVSRITPQPLVGSDMKLIAVSHRKLKDGIRMAAPEQPKIKGSLVPSVPVHLNEDKQTFYIELKDIRKTYEFEFRFSDTDNVKGKRHIIIEPVIDLPPQEKDDLRLAGPLRKPQMKGFTTSANPSGLMDAFLVTPDAIIPFKGTMRDEYGLTGMDWFYEYEVVDFELVSEEDLARIEEKRKTESNRFLSGPVRRAAYVVSGFHNLPTPLAPNILTPYYWSLIGPYVRADLKASKSELISGAIAMVEFGRRLKRLDNQVVKEEDLASRLGGKAPVQILPKTHSLVAEAGFDVGEWLSKKIKSDGSSQNPQLHYRLRVFMKATDNNIEANKPGSTLSKLPVTFLVVSEKELLAQILIEEELLRSQLLKTVNKLRDAKTVLKGELVKLNSNDPPLFTMDDRVKDGILDPVQEKLGVCQQVLDSFRRIVKEMQINRIDKIKLPSGYRNRDEDNRVAEMDERIIGPLGDITLANTGTFAVTEEAVDKLLRGINADLAAMKTEKNKAKLQQLLTEHLVEHKKNAAQADEKLTELVARLEKVLDAIGGEISWTKVYTQGMEIVRDQRLRVVNPLQQSHVRFQEYLLKILGELGE